VKVLEHEHEWAPLPERLEEAAPGGEVLRLPVAAERPLFSEADERA
jgi:hypothetical protein